jgi:hypothetical protein
MTIMAQTIMLAFRIAIVWAGGFLLAVSIRSALPDKLVISFYLGDHTVLVPYARASFWTCLLAAVVVTGLVVIRAMLADFGLRPMH